MYRTGRDVWLLDITNRHSEMRRRRRRMKQVLRALRFNVAEWLALEWLP